MARRQSRQRFPAGELSEDLTFWPGHSVLATAHNDLLLREMLQVQAIQRYQYSVALGEVKVPDVPISEVQNVRTALEGLRVIGGTETLTEKP